jgi:hypothetical protein
VQGAEAQQIASQMKEALSLFDRLVTGRGTDSQFKDFMEITQGNQFKKPTDLKTIESYRATTSHKGSSKVNQDSHPAAPKQKAQYSTMAYFKKPLVSENNLAMPLSQGVSASDFNARYMSSQSDAASKDKNNLAKVTPSDAAYRRWMDEIRYHQAKLES